MSLSIFARKKDAPQAVTQPCKHPELAPRWENAADMGKADRITYYACCSCGARIGVEEAEKRA